MSSIDPMIFIENLHLMYSKSNLIKMEIESTYEDAFEHKQNIMKEYTVTNTDLYITHAIQKLQSLFSMRGGGMSLDFLKDKIRKKIKKIKPRLS